MTEKELLKELNEIRKGMKLLDQIVHTEFEKDENGHRKTIVNERQAKVVRALLKLFKSLNWQLALNNYKQLNAEKDSCAIQPKGLGAECGDTVKISPCGEEHKGKTYFGIYIGQVSLGIHSSIDENENLNIEYGHHNPGIFVPELGKIIYGYESWWGKIESEEELEKLITEDTINNVWYVKLLKAMGGKNESKVQNDK